MNCDSPDTKNMAVSWRIFHFPNMSPLFLYICFICFSVSVLDGASSQQQDPKLTTNWKLTISKTLSASPTRVKRYQRSSDSSEEQRHRGYMGRYGYSNGLYNGNMRSLPMGQSPARAMVMPGPSILPEVTLLLLISSLRGGSHGGGGAIGGGGGLLDGGGGGGDVGLLPGPPVPPAPGPAGGGDFDNLWNLIEGYLFDTDPKDKSGVRLPKPLPRSQSLVTPDERTAKNRLAAAAALLSPRPVSEFRNARRPERRRRL